MPRSHNEYEGNLATPALVTHLENLVKAMPTPYAFIGDVCAQAHILQFTGQGGGVEAVLGHTTSLQVIGTQRTKLVRHRSPRSFGRFARYYDQMLEDRQDVLIECGDAAVALPVVPVEYCVAMSLCSTRFKARRYISSLIKTGYDQIRDEDIKSLLKNIGRHDAFERYKVYVYDFAPH